MEQLICTLCHQAYPSHQPRWRCDCGGMLDLQFTPRFDLEKIHCRQPNLWRYREALPLERDENIISFGEGYTPLLPVDIGGKEVWIKQDQLFPSGSYKDRGAALMISKARETGIRSVVEDSSGNAGCAVAAYCARVQIDCEIFVPADNSPGKLAQIRMYGARLNLVPGSREDTANAVWQAAQQRFYASHVWSPYFFHGTKTWAFEVSEQLGWRAPDSVVLPAGNGTLLLGVAIGFTELFEAGVTSKIPKIIAVQAQNCSPLYRAFVNGQNQPAAVETHSTLAEGIAIALPARGWQILKSVRESRGTFIPVTEEQILTALHKMARKGFYIEPTSAAVIAGLEQYAASCPRDELVVSVFTGHGLKATEKLATLVRQ